MDTAFEIELHSHVEEIEDMLRDKHKKYGDSALIPLRIFSKADTLEQLRVRMDDKLSRIATANKDDMEDPVLDLIGYLILYKMAVKRKSTNVETISVQ